MFYLRISEIDLTGSWRQYYSFIDKMKPGFLKKKFGSLNILFFVIFISNFTLQV